jgi:hypothetical protein
MLLRADHIHQPYQSSRLKVRLQKSSRRCCQRSVGGLSAATQWKQVQPEQAGTVTTTATTTICHCHNHNLYVTAYICRAQIVQLPNSSSNFCLCTIASKQMQMPVRLKMIKRCKLYPTSWQAGGAAGVLPPSEQALQHWPQTFLVC